MRRHIVWATVCAFACGGPAGSGTRQPDPAPAPVDSRFPTRDRLEKLAASSAEALAVPEARVDAWELAGPFPDAVGATPVAEPDPWEQRLAARGAIASAQMRCAARELGRFFAANRRQAPLAPRRFILARCGVVATDVAARAITSDIAPEVTRDQLIDAWREKLAGVLDKTASGVEAGVWIGLDGEFAVALVVSGTPALRITSAPRVADVHGWLRIEGEVLSPVASIEALINRGAWGVERCSLDPLIALPRFVALCAPDASDAEAWIEIAALPPGRVLGRGVFQHLAWPAGTPPARYRGREHTPVAASGEIRAQIAGLVADARAAAALPPLTLAGAESAIARQLAPVYFHAIATGDDRTVDTIALGLIAGWDVDARVQRGWFSSQLIASTDLGELVADMFERPFGRRVLLNPYAARLAVGEVGGGAGGPVGAVFATYATAGALDPAEARTTVRAVLDRQRKLAGLPPSAALPQAQSSVDRACARIERGDPAREAMRDATGDAALAIGRKVQAFLSTASVLSEAQLPAALVTTPSPVALCVALHRPPGAPWWTHTVLAVSGEPYARLDRVRMPGAD